MRRPKGRQAITFESCTAQDALGERTYAAPVTVKCRVDYIEKNIKDYNNNEFITSARIIAPAGTSVKRSDRITLPNGDNPYIGSISPKENYRLGKVAYVEIWVGRIEAGEVGL